MEVRSSLRRQMQLEKEVKELPKVIRELIGMISEYETDKGSIYINGEHLIDILKQEDDALRPRSVWLWRCYECRLCLLCIPDNQQDGKIWVDSWIVYNMAM